MCHGTRSGSLIPEVEENLGKSSKEFIADMDCSGDELDKIQVIDNSKAILDAAVEAHTHDRKDLTEFVFANQRVENDSQKYTLNVTRDQENQPKHISVENLDNISVQDDSRNCLEDEVLSVANFESKNNQLSCDFYAFIMNLFDMTLKQNKLYFYESFMTRLGL